jgi:sister chromatid cohesion protein DCC1
MTFLETLKSGNVSLKFSSHFQQESYILVEIPDALAAQIQTISANKNHHHETRSCFVIRGNEEDEVVCCTTHQTFCMRSAETSNSFLLAEIEGLADRNNLTKTTTWRIRDNLSSYLELIQITPRLEKLSKLLEVSLYKGPEYEQVEPSNKVFDIIRS